MSLGSHKTQRWKTYAERRDASRRDADSTPNQALKTSESDMARRWPTDKQRRDANICDANIKTPYLG
jgi:hypothetical protein